LRWAARADFSYSRIRQLQSSERVFAVICRHPFASNPSHLSATSVFQSGGYDHDRGGKGRRSALETGIKGEEGRAKLTKLYARDLQISDDLLELIVRRTKGVSGAFIKELMRRCAQFQIETSGGKLLAQAAIDAAIEEMLFAGGALNRRLLGGEGVADS
jgi:hypothetical protein